MIHKNHRSLFDIWHQSASIFKSEDMIWPLSNFDIIDLYRVTKSGILTVQEAVQAKTIMIYWVSQKYTQFWNLILKRWTSQWEKC